MAQIDGRSAGSSMVAMHDVNAVAATIAIVAAFLVTASPMLRLPVAVPLAMWSLSDGSDLRIVALGGSIGVTIGCAVLALGARGGRRPRTSGGAARTLGDRLAKSSQYGSLTFSAGALPMIPPRVLFPLLGGLRLPMRYALVGTFVGRLWLFALTTWIVRGIARGLSDSDHQAAQGLAVFAIAWVVFGTLGRIDMDAWRTEHRFRLRSDDDGRMTGMFGSFGAGGPGGPGMGAGPGIGGPWAQGPFADPGAADDAPRDEPLGDDEIEGVVLDDDEDDADDNRGDGPPPLRPA